MNTLLQRCLTKALDGSNDSFDNPYLIISDGVS